MQIKGILEADTVNYKKISMTIMMPYCDFKCDKESGCRVCQNSMLAFAPLIAIDDEKIIDMYLKDPLSEAIVFQGLEPFDSWRDLIKFIDCFRQHSQDDIVIYTGYTKEELEQTYYLKYLKNYDKIIIKYGRYIPNQKPVYDEVLGVWLASDNQYAEEL